MVYEVSKIRGLLSPLVQKRFTRQAINTLPPSVFTTIKNKIQQSHARILASNNTYTVPGRQCAVAKFTSADRSY